MGKYKRIIKRRGENIFMCNNSHTKRRDQIEFTYNDVDAYNNN